MVMFDNGGAIEISGTMYTSQDSVTWQEVGTALPARRSELTQRLRAATVEITKQEEVETLKRWAGHPGIEDIYQALLAGETLVSLSDLLPSSLNHSGKWGVAPARDAGSVLRLRVGSMTNSYRFSTHRWEMNVGRPWYHPYAYTRSTVFFTRIPVIPREVGEGYKPEKGDLIFFEANWKERLRIQFPALDPAILRPVANDLYRVIAVWDVSDLEATALSSALRMRGRK